MCVCCVCVRVHESLRDIIELLAWFEVCKQKNIYFEIVFRFIIYYFRLYIQTLICTSKACISTFYLMLCSLFTIACS